MSVTTTLQTAATNVDITEVGGERVIDFDIAANTDYEIQSCVMADEDGRVVEAAVRFGRVEERPELCIDEPILSSAWNEMVAQELGNLDAIEADLSDFGHNVPHLRVCREDVEEYGCETVDVETFVGAVETLAELVETVLRGDDRTIDAEIDAYL